MQVHNHAGKYVVRRPSLIYVILERQAMNVKQKLNFDKQELFSLHNKCILNLIMYVPIYRIFDSGTHRMRKSNILQYIYLYWFITINSHICITPSYTPSIYVVSQLIGQYFFHVLYII